MPKDWGDYLRNAMNKEELFRFLASFILNADGNMQVVTNIDDVIHTINGCPSNLDHVSCSHMEEADGRMLLHVKDMVLHGAKSVLIRCSDTDVVVLSVSFFHVLESLGLNELWILFGCGPIRRHIAVHTIARSLGEAKSVALRGFHAFTGCDTVSFFLSKGKRTAWKAWMIRQ